MVLEAFDSMDARNIRFKLNVDKIIHKHIFLFLVVM